MMRPLTRVAMALGLGLCAAPAAESQEYQIQFDRPVAVGRTCHVSVVAHLDETTTATGDGREMRVRDEKFTVYFDAQLTVLALGENKRPVKESAVVERFVKVEDEETTELVSKESVIVARVEGSARQFTVDGRPVKGGLGRAIELAYPRRLGKRTGDELFGTAEPQTVGVSWPLNPHAVASDPLIRGLRVEKEDVHGKATLQGVRRVGQIECLQVVAEATFNNLKPTIPEGLEMKWKHSVLQFRRSWLLPTDLSMDRLRESREMTSEMQFQGRPDPGGAEMVVKARFKRSVTVKYTY